MGSKLLEKYNNHILENLICTFKASQLLCHVSENF